MPYGLEGGLPAQALIKPTMMDDHFYRTLYANSGLEVLIICIDAYENDDSDDLEALATLPRMLKQMTGLQKLKLRLSKGVDSHPSRTNTEEYYTYQQVFPTLALWPRLTELSITGLAIGGYDLIGPIMARTKVTDLTLRCIELLDGTWEGVVEGLRHIRVTELSFRGSFKHRGGQIFVPHKTLSWGSEPETLEAIEDYVMYGGRHPCLDPDGDPESPAWWYLDMLPDEDFNKCKMFALQNGIEMPMLKRSANIQEFQKLHDSVVPP